MNEKGKQFIREQSRRYERACARKPDTNKFWQDHSKIEERIMRMALEEPST